MQYSERKNCSFAYKHKLNTHHNYKVKQIDIKIPVILYKKNFFLHYVLGALIPSIAEEKDSCEIECHADDFHSLIINHNK